MLGKCEQWASRRELESEEAGVHKRACTCRHWGVFLCYMRAGGVLRYLLSLLQVSYIAGNKMVNKNRYNSCSLTALGLLRKRDIHLGKKHSLKKFKLKSERWHHNINEEQK